MDIIKYESVQQKIIEIRDQKIIIDSDVAELYGVETKRINEAVKNNPDKFPNRVRPPSRAGLPTPPYVRCRIRRFQLMFKS